MRELGPEDGVKASPYRREWLLEPGDEGYEPGEVIRVIEKSDPRWVFEDPIDD